MGIKLVELIPIGSLGPTPLTPSGKNVYCKVFQTSRTDTVSTLKCALPAQASILHFIQEPNTVSNAGTTAATTVTVTNNTGTVTTGSFNQLTAGTAPVFLATTAGSLPNLEPLPIQGDLRISVQYAETGAVSTAGGPWNIIVTYVA